MEEIKKPAEEAIPKEFIESKKKRRTEQVYDYDKHTYVRDKEGNYVYKLNKEAFNNDLKYLASTFANHGVDINQIDFDEYKLDKGVSLSKIPKNTIAFLDYQDDFYVIDKRSSTSGSNNDHWFNRRVVRNRDGKYVDAYRIPDSQFLNGASDIWIIPEEILTRDVYKVRQERANLKRTNYPKRYKDFKEVSSWKDESPELYLDKSGFLIDRGDIKRKYKKLAEDLRLKRLEDNLIPSYEEAIDKAIKQYNEKSEKVFEVALRYFKLKHSLNEFERFTSSIDYAKDSLDQIMKDYEWELKYLKQYEDSKNEKAIQDTKKEIFKLIEKLHNFFTNGRGEDLQEIYLKALEIEKTLSNQSPSTLQSTEGYFTPKGFNSAFESITRPMPKRKK